MTQSILDDIAFKSIQSLLSCKYFYPDHITGCVKGIAWNRMGINLSTVEVDYVTIKVIDGLNKVKETYPERYE